MASGVREKIKMQKKKKKVRKDKWGQPLPCALVEESDDCINEAEEAGVEGEEQNEAKRQTISSCETNKVVVSGMPYTATEDDVRKLFQDVGSISHLQLSRFPDSGNFSGLAFLTFPTEEIARNSLKVDGTKMGNRFVKVEPCRANPQRKRKSEFLNEPRKAEGCLSAYIGNLSWDITEEDIRNCFRRSKITSIRFAVDKRTGNFRGFGHIDFADDESLEKAMEKNQVELNGRPVKVAYAVSNRN